MDCLFITSSKARALQFSVYPYLGVGVLSSSLKKEGLSCRLYDVDVRKGGINKIIREIEKQKPTVVGYSIMSISLPIFFKLTLAIRKRFPQIVLVAGGPHVTNDPQCVFDMGIDFGFRGQCEESFPEFIKRIKNGGQEFADIDGIVINKSGLIKEPASFDISRSVTGPDYTLYKTGTYQNIFYGRKWFTMITTAGCAYNCKFCKDPGKNRYAEYPLEAVFEQIRTLVNVKGCRWISFVDDSFTHNKQRVIEICKFILRENLKFRWTCCTRADVLDEELIRIMKEAGLRYVILGVEAGNEEIREAINKNISTRRYIDIIDELHRQGIRCLCSYVLGNPGESYQQIGETISLSLRLKANYAQYYNMTALPQSPIFRIGVNEKGFAEDVWSSYMRGETGLPYYVPQGLQLQRLKHLRTHAFLRYYLRPKQFFDLGGRLLKFFWDITFRP
jgi:anaerobic magnesium-protoporphyrin IX monomethyl ester cyclase